jgi:UDP-3-O-[3-hydroxymyristoyl] glucosamine N-acyltransferase
MLNQQSSGMTVAELAQCLKLDYRGDGNQTILSVASFSSATSHDLCFLQSETYLSQLLNSQCGAVIVGPEFTADVSTPACLIANNPHKAFVQAVYLLKPELSSDYQLKDSYIHPSAQLDESVELGANVHISANCVIAKHAKIGDFVRIGAGCIVEENVYIGDRSYLVNNVTLCHGVSLGKQVILHPGVVIGSDGFGLVYDEGEWIKIPHLGSVKIGDNVEIGANTTVDRGALDDTVIENGVKLDNLIQVAHNVHIGENTAIAACVGIAGSAIIGKNCRISGAAVVLGHLTVADNVTITAMSLVTKSIKQSGTYSSGTPLMENHLWHRNNVRYKSLDKLARTISRLDKTS